MDLQIARQIIDALAQGIHPLTGEAMPEDSPYNAPPIIRVSTPFGGSSRCSMVVEKVEPSGL